MFIRDIEIHLATYHDNAIATPTTNLSFENYSVKVTRVAYSSDQADTAEVTYVRFNRDYSARRALPFRVNATGRYYGSLFAAVQAWVDHVQP